MPFLDVSRFDHLPQSVVIQRIGALLALGIVRHQHSQRHRLAKTSQADLILDPIEREIVRYLSRMGSAALQDLQRALGVSPGVLRTRLKRLRLSGHCLMEGRTGGSRYRLRTDYSSN